MIEIHRSALVLVSAEQLYDLINDIEQYPQFLEGVVATRLLEASSTEMLGELTVRKAGFERTLVTRNTLVRPLSIAMNLVEGPLDSLTGLWQIKPPLFRKSRTSLFIPLFRKPEAACRNS